MQHKIEVPSCREGGTIKWRCSEGEQHTKQKQQQMVHREALGTADVLDSGYQAGHWSQCHQLRVMESQINNISHRTKVKHFQIQSLQLDFVCSQL